MMKQTHLVALLIASLIAGACSTEDVVPDEGTENRTPTEELYVTSDTSEGYQTDAPAPVTAVQGSQGAVPPAAGSAPGPLTATGNFQPLGNAPTPGSVVITETGPGTQISVKIDRYTAGTTLEVSLVRGRCQASGAEVASLGRVEVGQAGFATGIFQASVPTRTIMDGQHSVRLNTPGAERAPEFVLACADIPAV